ncbi:MAG TPA: hypothetical protein P5514_00810 [Bacteroidales bacterium]|nr:hypothetical protein [Bacteroidales bacterium]HPE55495.1 hypothetical protein [Bacteroidales bacterium]HRX95456.1 hypothetical protein [Bacteroidales bacterium]
MTELTNKSTEPTKAQLKILLNRYLDAGSKKYRSANWNNRTDKFGKQSRSINNGKLAN